MKRFATILVLTGLMVAVSSALAMSSATYRLDWFTPLTSGGGGHAASASYAADLTIGQTAIGQASSVSYGTGLGFWYGMVDWFRVYMPLVLRNYP